jgi:acyl-CoA thioesterase FadM
LNSERFTIVEDVVAPGEPQRDGHLLDFQTQELVTTMWRRYVAAVRDSLDFSRVQPVLRKVSYTLDGEAMPGDSLQVGLRMRSRTRRSCTFEGAVWHAGDGRPVHTAELVMVFVDTTARASVEVPAEFWAAVERFEGGALTVDLPAGATP